MVENNVNATIHMIDKCSYNKSAVSVSGKYDFGKASSLALFYNYFWDDYERGRVFYGGEWARNFASAVFNQGLGDMFSMKASIAYHVDDLLHTYDMGGTNYYTPKQRATPIIRPCPWKSSSRETSLTAQTFSPWAISKTTKPKRWITGHGPRTPRPC